MKIEFLINTAIIEAANGAITKIAPPEDIEDNITNLLTNDFTFEADGLLEHYVAYATNHTDQEVVSEAIQLFKTEKASN